MNMIKHTYFCLIAILIVVIVSCTQSPKVDIYPNRIPFVIAPQNPLISLTAKFNDSITANLVFDTGGTALLLDSSYCTIHPSILSHLSPDTILPTGYAWSEFRTPASIYYSDINLKLGETNMIFNKMKVYNLKRDISTIPDGLFNIPQNDTTHIWEINFEHNYLEIHSDSVIPQNSLIIPLVQGKYKNDPRIYANLSLKIACPDGDTTTLDRTFLLDTGIPWDVVLISGTPEFDFFNHRKDAVWTLEPFGHTRRYNTNAIFLDQMQLDSLRVYTFDYPTTLPVHYLVGLNFLKRFNVFLDMRNRLLGLQPINNFQRVINPTKKRFYISSRMNGQGEIIITKLADHTDNFFKNAGLKEGDEIVAVNGKVIKTCTQKDLKELFKQDTLVHDIRRKGKPLKITVVVDKNEIQGD